VDDDNKSEDNNTDENRSIIKLALDAAGSSRAGRVALPSEHPASKLLPTSATRCILALPLYIYMHTRPTFVPNTRPTTIPTTNPSKKFGAGTRHKSRACVHIYIQRQCVLDLLLKKYREQCAHEIMISLSID
jgi:hypothetical protein